MFSHIFITRVKCLVRDRQTIFWTLMFPIILATMFHFAFMNIGKAETFEKADIAVVNNAEYKSDSSFQSALSYMTKEDKATGSKAYFSVTYCDSAKADNLLKNDKIVGYINFDNGPRLFVKDSGISQTILSEFINEYNQTGSAATAISKLNPSAMRSFTANMQSKDYLRAVSLSSTKPDEMLQYFYALIAMACLYGGMFGLKEVQAIQANQTAQAARVNIAPVHKMKTFLVSLFAATVVQFICALVLIAYLALVLKVDFGGKVALVLLACLVSCLTGVTFGAAISALIKKHIGIQYAVLIAGTCILSFFSGLYFDRMRYIVEVNAPVLNMINPASVITDTFYSLYYFDTYTRYFTNIALLLGFSTIFFLVVYFVLRRQRYDSI